MLLRSCRLYHTPTQNRAVVMSNNSRNNSECGRRRIRQSTLTFRALPLALTSWLFSVSRIDHEDQIDAILEGLPEEYKPVKDQIEARDTPPTITEIHERLINHEVRLQSQAPSPAATFPVTANVAQQRSNNNNRGYRNNNNSGYRNNNSSNWQNQQYNNNNRNTNRSPRPYLGRCQICGTQGHGAKRCPQLHSFQSVQTPPTSSPFTPWQLRANLASKKKHCVHG